MYKVVDLYPNQAKTRKPPNELPPPFKELKRQLKSELLTSLGNLVNGRKTTRVRKWLTADQVQQKLGLSTSALRRLKNEKSVPFYVVGSEVYFDAKDVDREIRRRKYSNKKGLVLKKNKT